MSRSVQAYIILQFRAVADHKLSCPLEYKVVNLISGQTDNLENEKHYDVVYPSPNGKHILYFCENAFYSYDTETRTRVQLTTPEKYPF